MRERMAKGKISREMIRPSLQQTPVESKIVAGSHEELPSDHPMKRFDGLHCEKLRGSKMSMPGSKHIDIDWVREQFPSLKLQANGHAASFLDGPAGTQVPRQVMQAIQNYMLQSNANTYGVFETSRRTNETILSARAAMADFFNCMAEEVVFGQNMTTITFALARAIGRELKVGDEIVVTTLDHYGTFAPWLQLY